MPMSQAPQSSQAPVARGGNWQGKTTTMRYRSYDHHSGKVSFTLSGGRVYEMDLGLSVHWIVFQ